MDAQGNAAIKSEIQNDPAGRGYAGQTAQQQSVLLNASYQVNYPAILPGAVHVRDLVLYVISLGKWEPIVKAAADDNNPAHAAAFAAIQAVQYFAIDVPITLTDPTVGNLLTGLVTAGLLSPADADGLPLAVSTATSIEVSETVEMAPRVSVVLAGIAGAPNQVTAADVTAALNS